jgi:ketosteroid isomerase-like protein
MFTMKEGIKKPVAADPKDLEKGSAEWTRCYYDAWNRRDWEWISAMLSPDIEWANSARDERLQGMQAVIASFRSAIDGFPSAMIEIRAVHVAGSTIIAECAIKNGDAPSAARSASFCEVLELKNGRCVRGTTYADSVRLLMDMSQTPAAA